ncbi:MAG: protein kinase [Bdellovibrionales bacterium]
METLNHIGRSVTQRFEQFGKYLLLEKLATGGMAEVFLARASAASGISKFVAIKRILPQYAESPEFIDMFKDEAKIAVNLGHSNIVSIYDFGVQSNQFYLVMDYVEGRNLRQILNKVKKSNLRLSIDQVIYVIKEIASGLDHAHRCLDGTTGKPLNITHRDMSPQNVMISFEGEVKIVDFGIAKAESQMETTRAGTLKGKFGYMSPEQAEGQTVDLRTDIFSLGIVLWELLANDRLFIASNELNTLRKIRDCQVPSLRKINPNIPVELERITMKALARDRNLRYQTAAAMHRDLNRFLNRHYPEFSPQDFAGFIKSQFQDEIFSTRQRLVDYSKIPTQEEGKANPLASPMMQVPAMSIEKGTSTGTGTASNQTGSYVTGESDEVSEGYTPTNTGPVPNPSHGNIMPPESFANQPNTSARGSAANIKAPVGNDEATRVASAAPPQTGPLELRLDEKALGREMRRARHSDSSIYGLQTEEVSSPSIRGRTSGGTPLRSSRSRRRKKKLIPAQAVNIAMSLFIGIGFYTYLAKYQTSLVLPMIVALDPYLRPFHSLVGIYEGHNSSGSTRGAPQNPPPTPPPTEPSVALPDLPAPVLPVEPAPALPPPEKLTGKPKEPVQAAGSDEDPAPLSSSEPKDSLLITSTPSGAEIFVNGRPSGSLTPSRVDIPTSREFSITLRRMGYLDYRRTSLRRDQLGSRLSGTLQPALVGYLDIDVIPPQNARVYINGRLLKGEHLPISGYAVPAETSVMIKAEDPVTQQTAQQLVRVPKDRRVPVLLDLRRSNPKNDRQPSRNR